MVCGICGSLTPAMRFENLEIHTVFLRFSVLIWSNTLYKLNY